jgi:hypothetical protein
MSAKYRTFAKRCPLTASLFRTLIYLVSLLVNLVPKFPDINIERYEAMVTRNDIFGFESWRKTLWGHDCLEKLGCTLLPRLKYEANLFIYDKDLEILNQEFKIVLQNLTYIQESTNIESEIIKERVQNALDIIRVAQLHIEKVGIVLW